MALNKNNTTHLQSTALVHAPGHNQPLKIIANGGFNGREGGLVAMDDFYLFKTVTNEE